MGASIHGTSFAYIFLTMKTKTKAKTRAKALTKKAPRSTHKAPRKMSRGLYVLVIIAAVMSLSPWDRTSYQQYSESRRASTQKWVTFDMYKERTPAFANYPLSFTPALPSSALGANPTFVPTDAYSYSLYVLQQLQAIESNYYSNLDQLRRAYGVKYDYVDYVNNFALDGSEKKMARGPAISPKENKAKQNILPSAPPREASQVSETK